MSIPSGIFKRRDCTRTDSKSWECWYCYFVFLSTRGSTQHTAHCRNFPKTGRPPQHSRDPLLPEVTISLLQTCRMIRFEASPILYSKNRFHFTDPVAANNFRWATDSAQARATQEIEIKMCWPAMRWTAYFTARTFSLGQDFPNLRRLTIDTVCTDYEEQSLRSMSKGLRGRSPGLDWVLVILHNEGWLRHFEPLVDRGEDSRNDKKEVQRHVWAKERGHPWKNALLWWGAPGEVLPHKCKMIGNQPL